MRRPAASLSFQDGTRGLEEPAELKDLEETEVSADDAENVEGGRALEACLGGDSDSSREESTQIKEPPWLARSQIERYRIKSKLTRIGTAAAITLLALAPAGCSSPQAQREPELTLQK